MNLSIQLRFNFVSVFVLMVSLHNIFRMVKSRRLPSFKSNTKRPLVRVRHKCVDDDDVKVDLRNKIRISFGLN